MPRPIDPPTSVVRREARADGGPRAGFEAAQRELFESFDTEPRSRFLDLEAPAVRTHVLEVGSPGAAPPLVFVHGTAAFGGFLSPLLAAFDDAHAVAFDRPGYGLSGPYTYAEGDVARTAVDATLGVIDGLGLDRVDLVGHSMGGHAALRLALEHPGRVRQVVTLGAIPGLPGTRPPVPVRLMTVRPLARLLRWLQRPGEAGVLDVAAVFGERESIQDHPALVRAIAALDADPTSVAAGLSEFDALASLRGWHRSARLGPEALGRLDRPTTMIWGDRDPLGGPDAVGDALAAVPDLRVETVDAGHMPFLAHAGRCAELVRETWDGRGE